MNPITPETTEIKTKPSVITEVKITPPEIGEVKTLPPEIARQLKLSKASQIGIVVKDLGKAMEFYSKTFHSGPWYRVNMLDEKTYVERDGQRIHSEYNIALAYHGNTQIELIEPRGIDKCIFAEHLENHGEGIHHLGFSVSNIEDKLVKIKQAGIEILQFNVVKTYGGLVIKTACLDTAGIGGIIIELIETKLRGFNVKLPPRLFWIACRTGDVTKVIP